MELNAQRKLAQHIFRLLKVNEISFPIGRTNKGNLAIKFTESNDDFEIYLDAVPLPIKDFLNDENNIELKRMLEKYWFDREEILGAESIDGFDTLPAKKKGRPKGSKNVPKPHKETT